MIIETMAKVVTCRVYDKKDKETKEPTGEKGLMISLLIDEVANEKLSGRVVSPFAKSENYRGLLDFSDFSRLQKVKVEMNYTPGSNGSREFFELLNLEKID